MSVRLLVVEDNDDTRQMIGLLLEDVCRVETARDVPEALARATQAAGAGDPYAAVLADVNLGTGPTGRDLLEALRGIAETEYAGATPTLRAFGRELEKVQLATVPPPAPGAVDYAGLLQTERSRAKAAKLRVLRR